MAPKLPGKKAGPSSRPHDNADGPTARRRRAWFESRGLNAGAGVATRRKPERRRTVIHISKRVGRAADPRDASNGNRGVTGVGCE